MILPIMFYLFIGVAVDPANVIDDAQSMRVKTLAACRKLAATYEAAHKFENLSNAPAFHMRWATSCVPLVLGEKQSGDL